MKNIHQRMGTTLRNVFCLAVLFAGTTGWSDTEQASLYQRLGGWDGIHQIVVDTIANHERNPAISHFFANVDKQKLTAHVTAFFAAGTGGPAMYIGRDMTSAHASMNMSNADFDTAVADVMLALKKNDIGEAEQQEVAAILESLRPAVMGATSAGQ